MPDHCYRSRQGLPARAAWRRAATLLLLAASACVPAPPTEAQAAPEPEGCALIPVWKEEFDAPRIARDTIGWAQWTAHTPWNGDFGEAAFADPGAAGPFRAEGGILSITASRDASGKWRSGLIAAADATGKGIGARFGYFEARMKFPPGPGTWPAFWLMPLKPANASKPNVEVDVVEYYGHDASAYHSVIHVWYADEAKTRGAGVKTTVPPDTLVEAFHIYGVDVSPERIVFFLDGRQVWSQPTPPELDTPLYPIVNLALGSGWPIDKTPNPSTLLVDYVHIYQREGAIAGCHPGLPGYQFTPVD